MTIQGQVWTLTSNGWFNVTLNLPADGVLSIAAVNAQEAFVVSGQESANGLGGTVYEFNTNFWNYVGGSADAVAYGGGQLWSIDDSGQLTPWTCTSGC